MAPRPFWKGYLKLSLVTCPVAMTPATTDNAKIRFHVLNRRTGNRVESRYVDALDGAPVDEDNLVKGYAKGEEDFVLFEDEELKALALKSTATIDIESFIPAGDIDAIWFDKPHYLTPSDPVGEEAFAVIRDAMKATGMAALSRVDLALRRRDQRRAGGLRRHRRAENRCAGARSGRGIDRENERPLGPETGA
jgi:DNA end-binding protein Ku